MRASRMTALNFFEDLASGYARRWFFWFFAILTLACLLLVFQIEGWKWATMEDVIASVLIEILTGSVIILAFYAFYVYFIGPNVGIREVSVVRSQDIKEKMRALPLEVSHYMFWGRSGSFFRAYLLVELNKQARAKRHAISIEALLPDPSDIRLVNTYRDILQSLGEDHSGNPLLRNVIATCITCAIVAANNRYLEVEIRLSRFIPSFRLDLSDNGAILTQDAKEKAGLFLETGSEFYEMFRSTMIGERNVSRKVAWDENQFRDLELAEESCNEDTLSAFDIDVPEPEKIQQEVARLISERPHRYK